MHDTYESFASLTSAVFGGYENETEEDREQARTDASSGRKKQNPHVSPACRQDESRSLKVAATTEYRRVLVDRRFGQDINKTQD